MSDPGFGTGKQAKGGVKVGVKEKEATKTSPKEKEKFEVEWRVLLHNDDVHTFDYVSRKLAEVRLCSNFVLLFLLLVLLSCSFVKPPR